MIHERVGNPSCVHHRDCVDLGGFRVRQTCRHCGDTIVTQWIPPDHREGWQHNELIFIQTEKTRLLDLPRKGRMRFSRGNNE